MLRNEDHFAFESFSLNLCKLSSLNVRIIIFLSVQRVRVASSKYFFVHCAVSHSFPGPFSSVSTTFVT